MLLEISIKNFAIIQEVSLTFDRGMTVLTGETGAGKSIIIDAMNLMLGSRATTDVIRHGSPKAEIEGLFSLEKNAELEAILTQQGIVVSDELIIRREILANGRSVSRVNGQLVNLSVLKEMGPYLVDIHGQHDQEELMRSSHHIGLLDSFGQVDFQELKASYQQVFEAYRTLRKQVLDKQKNELEHKARIEMLEYQIAEIEAADLQAGEDEVLLQERDRLLNHKQIADTLTNAYAMLENEDFSSLSNLRSAMNDMQSVEEYDKDYKEISQQLTESYYVIEDISKRLADILEDLDFDGNRLLQVENRLDLIYSITRKYGGQVDDVLEYFAKISQEYQLLTGSNLTGQDLEGQLKVLEADLIARAGQLSQALRVFVTGLDVVVAHQPGGAGRVGIEHRGEVAHGLRLVHKHAAQLAAAQHAQGRSWQEGLVGAHAAGGKVMLRATSVCSARKASRRWRSSGFSLASRATANRAALAAPAVPMANVATGMPLGICTMLCSESTPCRWRLATGTPSTGTVVLAAIMPGRWAAPPAPAMMAFRPRPAAASA